MKRVWLAVIVILVAVAVGGVAWQGRDAVGRYNGLLAAPSTVTRLTTASFADASVSVKVAQTEGKYVVALAALNRDVIALLEDGQTRSYISAGSPQKSPAYSYDELTADRLSSLRILVYRQGWSAVKRPLLALAIGDIKEPLKPASVAAFKQSLLPR